MKSTDSSRALLARNMKRLRDIHGLSQMALAERVGCSTTLIGNIETFKRFPSAENIDRIALALGVPIAELFKGDSAVIKQVETEFEVRERLEREALDALRERWDSKRPRPRGDAPDGEA